MTNSTKVQVIIGLIICVIIAISFFGNSDTEDDLPPTSSLNKADKPATASLQESESSMKEILRDQQEIVSSLAIANKELEQIQTTEANLMEEYVALGGAIESGTALDANNSDANGQTKARLKQITATLEQNRKNAESIRHRIETTEQKLDQLFAKLKSLN